MRWSEEMDEADEGAPVSPCHNCKAVCITLDEVKIVNTQEYGCCTLLKKDSLISQDQKDYKN